MQHYWQNMTQKSKRGGPRPNSGRPKKKNPRININMRIEPDIVSKFKEICKITGRTQSEQFSLWVRRSGEH